MKNIAFLLFLAMSFCGFSQPYDLTGYWQTDAGGCYQFRQRQNEIWWTTEQASNVFHGYIAGNTLTGNWYDMPSNPARNYGESLAFRIEGNSRLVKISESAPYNGSVWARVNGPCGNSSATTTAEWVVAHEHVGCTSPNSYCRRYENKIEFMSPLNQGPLEARYANVNSQPSWSIVLKGILSGTVYAYQYYFENGSHLGDGTITFSPDFKSFTGTFRDFNGHRGTWYGRR